jgi:hypothetical protein
MSRPDDHRLNGADVKGISGGASAAEVPKQRKEIAAAEKALAAKPKTKAPAKHPVKKSRRR